ncbi:MAG: hypothetical protein PHU68_01120 [Paludibacter sp.]|nr:hypothetical protein [Paludibacter sp.]
MNITEKIKSYEDACNALGLNPEDLPVVDMLPEKDKSSIISYYKLIVIIRALNEGWEPDFYNIHERKYYNWLWVDSAGFVFVSSSNASSSTAALLGSRLCFKNSNLARFAAEHFLELYKSYLLLIR